MSDPDDDMTVPFRLAVTLPTFVCGLILSGFLVVKMQAHRSILLRHNIDKIAHGILVFFAIWSILSCIRIMCSAFLDRDTLALTILAELTNVSITILLAAHAILALERSLVIRNATLQNWHWQCIVGFSSITAIASTVVSLCSKGVDANELWPENEPFHSIWTGIVCTAFLFNLALMMHFYISSYVFLKRKIGESLADHRVDHLRLMMQRRVFYNCVIMSAAVVISYIPQISFYILIACNVLEADSAEGIWLNTIQLQFVAADSVVTPVLIMYFMKPLRRIETGGRFDNDEG